MAKKKQKRKKRTRVYDSYAKARPQRVDDRIRRLSQYEQRIDLDNEELQSVERKLKQAFFNPKKTKRRKK